MSFSGSIVRKRTRSQIRAIATEFRDMYDLIDPCFDVERLVEVQMPKMTGLYVSPLEDHEMPEALGFADVKNNVIYLRGSVYEGMRHGHPDAREIVMHEVGHMVLHRGDNILMAWQTSRLLNQCSEWQADTFSAEVLGHHEYLPLAEGCSRRFARVMGISIHTAVQQFHRYKEAGLLK